MNHLQSLWNDTQAADEFSALPAGTYKCRLIAGQLSKASTGTPCFRLTFEALEGEYAGRRIWHSVWLTEAALPLAKRDLAKIGIATLAQLEQPIPQGLICELRVVLRVDNDGIEYNRVRALAVTGTEAPDPFAPTETN